MTADYELVLASPEAFWIGFAVGVLIALAAVQIYSALHYNYERSIERRAEELMAEWKKEQMEKEWEKTSVGRRARELMAEWKREQMEDEKKKEMEGKE